jgi:hypothetical protein
MGASEAAVVPTETSPPAVLPMVRSQILVVVRNGGSPFVINPTNDLTRGEEPVKYEDAMDILSNPHDYLDLWIEANEEDDNSRIAVRLFGRNVVTLTQAFMYPSLEDSVQS